MTARRHVVIIDSGGANLASLVYAFDRLGASSVVSAAAAQIAAADRIVLPGVGNAASIMTRLEATGLVDVIRTLQCPVLGICLGMQLLFEHSAEGPTAGLGLLKGGVEALVAREDRPVPHMGWNTLTKRKDDPLLHGLSADDWFYFVHGYFAPPDGEQVLATTNYGDELAAVVRHRNFRGVQFHPERSSHSGARLLANFLDLTE